MFSVKADAGQKSSESPAKDQEQLPQGLVVRLSQAADRPEQRKRPIVPAAESLSEAETAQCAKERDRRA